jgi:hypothetical protein
MVVVTRSQTVHEATIAENIDQCQKKIYVSQRERLIQNMSSTK